MKKKTKFYLLLIPRLLFFALAVFTHLLTCIIVAVANLSIEDGVSLWKEIW